MLLLEDLKTILNDKDLMVILPLGVKPEEWVKSLGKVATTKAKIYVDYKGKEAFSGSINFSDIVFNIMWADSEMLEISTMEYSKCVKCLMGTFEGSWRYAQKW